MEPRAVNQREIDRKMEEAIGLHRKGQYAEAEALYREVLTANPDHAEAIQLLGVLAQQQGRPERAVELIERALQLEPNNAIFHSNLGASLRATGRLEDAARHLRDAVRIAPAYHDARKNLAVVLQNLGKLEDAVRELEQVVAAQPRDIAAVRSLGVARYRMRSPEKARAAFEAAIRIQPQDVQSHNNLGVILRELGDLVGAERHLEQARQLAPESVDAHNNTGLLRYAQGRYREAEKHYRDAVRLNPQFAQAHNNLAVALKRLNRLHEAEQHLREARRLDPQDAACLVNLSDVLTELGRPAEALILAEEAVRRLPSSAEAHNNLATTLKALERGAEARTHFERALELNPRYHPALNNLANEYVARGDVSRGEELFLRILEDNSDDIPALYGLGSSTKHKFTPERVARVNALLERPDLLDGDRELLHFTLAHALERQDQAAPAFEHALRANAMHKAAMTREGRAFRRDEHLTLIDDLIEVFHKGAFAELASSGLDTEVPVFVVGMPRSGTTLVEQILASHPRVFGADELNDIGQMAYDLPHEIPANEAYPRCVRRMDAILTRRLAERYLGRLRQLGGSADRVVDKMTVNFLHLGLIAMLFPRARVIHCMRDMRDTCLSCFFHNFASGGLRFTFDLEDLGFYYRQYERIMEHWRKAFPGRLFEMPYEQLVADQADWTRKLLDFCGLEWHEGCLQFHRNTRQVRTASAQQVRQPMYTRSVGRWKPYEKQLQPLVEAWQGVERPPAAFTPASTLAPAAAPVPTPAAGGPSAAVEELVQQGTAHHRAGRPDEAKACYERALKLNPDHPEALHLSGVLLYQKGQAEDALPLLRRAAAGNPRDAAIQSNLGLVLWQLRRMDEAVAAFERCLELDPGYVIGRKNLAIVLRDAAREREAITHLERVGEATPNDPGVWRSLGALRMKLARHEKALEAFVRARDLEPNNADAHNNVGVALKELGRSAEAEAAYREALRLRPNSAEVRNNLGILFHFLSRPHDALAEFNESLRLKPDYAEAIANRGISIADLGRHEEAIECFRKAIALDPNNPEFHSSLGGSLQLIGYVDQAFACYEEALRLKPDFFWGHFNRAQAWLLIGDYERGWPEYEWREKRPGHAARDFSQPRWDGTPMPGGTICLYVEQGLGDTLQFARFAETVKERVGTVVVECQESLIPILSRTKGIDRLVARGQPLGHFDVQAPLMSIPAILKMPLDRIPAPVPYLFPAPELVAKWRERLAAIPGFKVGICWQGNPKYGHDMFRSVPLKYFEPLARVPGVTLIALQKGHGTEQTSGVPFPIVSLGDDVDTTAGAFMDTAAIASCLDLVVTSDTAMAHLIGGLGIPYWLATAHSPDWRWLQEGEKNPWYPSARLFRQPKRRDWESVFEAMKKELEARVPAGAAPAPAPPPPAQKRSFSVEVSAGEMLDKLTILQIKTERIRDAKKVRSAQEELTMLTALRQRDVPGSPALDDLVKRLKGVNEKLWDIEDEIRVLERAKDFGARFIELARSVYWTNDERAEIKRLINELVGSTYVEVKEYVDYR